MAVFQVGRVENGGATAIGVATSADAGSHWRSGLLPGMTSLSPQPGTDPRASDPTVGFDAAHGVWLATALGIASSSFQILVSRSTDGIAWSGPIAARTGAERRARQGVGRLRQLALEPEPRPLLPVVPGRREPT